MIVCKKCNDVLYTNTMPEGLDEVVQVLCLSCTYSFTMSTPPVKVTITQEITYGQR